MYLLVRDVGRAKGVLERSLEVVEILRGCEEIIEAGGRFAYFWKKRILTFLSCLSSSDRA